MAESEKLFKDADSRLKGYFGQVTHPDLPMKRTFCFLCGAPAGYCSMDCSRYDEPGHIVVTCNDCDSIMVNLGAKPVPQNILDAFGLVQEPAEIKPNDVNRARAQSSSFRAG
jgi:hypothetical protein